MTVATTAAAPRGTEHFGYIRSVSSAGPAVTLAFDEAAFLTGKKATKTYPLANDAQITAKRCPLCRNGKSGEVGAFVASFMEGRQTYAAPYRGKYGLYWLTIEGGRVVAIDEQYVP